jgi:ABC-type phosphate/phosphonate transport system substrate-binding protein
MLAQQFIGRVLILLTIFYLSACGSTNLPTPEPSPQVIWLGFAPTDRWEHIPSDQDVEAIAAGIAVALPWHPVVRHRIYNDVHQGVADLTAGLIHVLWVDSITYTVSNGSQRRTSALTRFPDYDGLIIARQGSGITALSQVSGHTFAVGKQTSPASWLYPLRELSDSRVKNVTKLFFMTPAEIATAVCRGVADAGGFYKDARDLPSATSSCPNGLTTTQTIAPDSHIVGDPQIVSINTPKPLKLELTAALLSLNTNDAARNALQAVYGSDTITSVGPNDYSDVRASIDEVAPSLLKP